MTNPNEMTIITVSAKYLLGAGQERITYGKMSPNIEVDRKLPK